MNRRAFHLLLVCVLFLSACSKRRKEAEAQSDAEWADIQPITNAVAAVEESVGATNRPRRIVQSAPEDYAPLVRRLKEMESPVRAVGETLATGKGLVFDYKARWVRMEHDVVVVDDRGTLETDRLKGRFSVSNEVEQVDAAGHVRADVRYPKGKVLLTGDHLVLDRPSRVARMEGNAVATDAAHGKLAADRLVAHFSVSNEVEAVEARGQVRMENQGRTAEAERADYDYQTGFVQMEGRASVWDGANRLSGERIRMWTQGERRIVCEPNAMLKITGKTEGASLGKKGSALGEKKVGNGRVDTEIRADILRYNEAERVVVFDGNVRVRDPQVAMNCDKLRLHLKEGNEIDWIEALSGVIIQLDDKKALGERARYYVDEGRFVLDGDPKLKMGRNIITGDRITFWQGTQRMVCEPNARALLYPDEETKAKFQKDL